MLSLLLKDAGHDVAISAFWGLGGTKMEWNDMPVYPAGPDYGDTWIAPYAAHFGEGDPLSVQVITLMDVWTLKNPVLAQLNLAAWCPVDHDPLSPIVHEFFRRSHGTPIAMSRFGEQAFRDAGLDPLYAPHAVDTEVFGPFPQAEIREANGLPADAFIVGMVANNKGNAPPRKAFPQVFEAFAEFHKRHDDAFLYVHSDPENIRDGLNLLALAEKTGVPPKRLSFTPPIAMQLGMNQSLMAGLYSSLDVLACPSYGEGFGIPIVEAQSCGVPVIVNDWTAMPELVGHGWITEGERWWDMSQGSWFKHATTSSILDCLEQAYLERGGGSEKAREFALGYDVRTVFEEHWKPILATLEERMGERGQMPAVTLNRANRRRKTRGKKAA
jgi:glycosyltransferase involved in cell wall biosynthesis